MPKQPSEQRLQQAQIDDERERKAAARDKRKEWRDAHPVGWNQERRHIIDQAQRENWSSQDLARALGETPQEEEPPTTATTEATEAGTTTTETTATDGMTEWEKYQKDQEEYLKTMGGTSGTAAQERATETGEQTVQETLGYDPTYWQAPERIAEWYHAIKATPPGMSLPEWMTPELKGYIEETYKYMEWRNGGAPETQWKYLNAQDGALGLLAALPTPPAESMFDDDERAKFGGVVEQAAGATIEMVKNGEAAWMDIPEEQRAALLADPTFDIQQFDIQMRQQVLADPNFNWDALPDWQKWVYTIQSNPIVQKVMATPIAAQGAKLGSQAGGLLGAVPVAGAVLGPVGKIVGGALGGLGGYGLALVGGEEYNPMGGFDDQPTNAAKAMYTLNVMAQTTEQILGVAAQAYTVATGDTQRPGETRQEAWERFTSNLDSAWAAGNLTYESMQTGTNFIRDLQLNILPFYSDEYYEGLKEIQGRLKSGTINKEQFMNEVAALKDTLAGPRAAPGQDFILGKKEAVNILPDEMMPRPDQQVSQMDYVLSKYGEYIAEEVAKGRDVEEVKTEVYEWANQYASAFFKDFAMQMKLDPLNVLPKVEGAALSEFLKRSGGENTPLFRGGFDEPSKVVAEWKASVGQMDATKVGELNAVSRWLSGYNKSGEMTAGVFGLVPNETLTRTTPQEGMKGWVQRMMTLAPENRAKLAMSMAADHLGAIASHLTPEEFGNFFKSLQKMDLDAAKNLAGDVVGSAEFYTVIPMMRGFDLDAMKVGMWDVSAENRGLMLRVADVLGMDAGRLVEDLGQPNSAARVFEQLRQKVMNSTDKAAKTLLEDMDAGRFTVKDLEQIGRTFNGPDALPWHPAQFQAMALDAFKSHAEKWAVDYFKIKPGGFAAQIAKTLKGVQSVILLGYSPKYIIDNVINGEVTMAASGVYGMMTMKQIDAWTKRFGFTPDRMADSGMFGHLGIEGKNGKGSAIADAMRSKGVLGDVQKAISKFGEKYTITPLAGKMEGMQGARAMTTGMKQMWGKVWERGRGFSKMDAGLVKQLSAIDPLLPEFVYRAIESGINQKEVMDALTVRQAGVKARDLVTGAAQKMGMSTSQAVNLLEQAGIMDALDGYLKGADTPEKVDAAFRSVMKRAEDWVAIRKGQELRHKAEHVANALTSEGENRMWEVILDNVGYRNDQWIDHYMTADEVAATVEAMPDEFQGQKSLAWLDWYEKEQRAWSKTNADVLANLKGVMQALGLNHPEGQRMLALMAEEFDTWGQVYDFRLKQYAEHYETWKGKFSQDTIETRMAELEQRGALIDEQFQRAFETERVKEEQIRDMLVEMVRAKYGDAVADVTMRAYQQTIDFRAEMTGALKKHRKEVKNIWGADRRAANRKFYQGDYLMRVVELRKVWEDGVGKVQDATKGGGQKAEGGTPTPTPTPPTPTTPTTPTMAEPMAQTGLDTATIAPTRPAVSEPTPPAVKSAGNAEVWKIASENGMSGLDANGNQVFGAKLDVIKFVKKWGGAEGGAVKRFDDITPEIMQKATDAKAAWLKDQMELMPKMETKTEEAVKAESEALPEPSEKTNAAAEEAMQVVTEEKAQAVDINKIQSTWEQPAENPVYKQATTRHISELDPVAFDALQYELYSMRARVNDGEPGYRTHTYNLDAPGSTTRGVPSTYPDWYGPLKREKKFVLAALDALIGGKDKPETGLYTSLKAIAADLLANDPVMGERWDWAKAWGYEKDIIFRFDREVSSAVRDFYNQASEGNAWLMEMSRERLVQALAEYPKEALDSFVEVLDDNGKFVDGTETYRQYHERLWNEADKLYQQAVSEKLNAQAEIGIREAEARGEMAMTREVLREQMIEEAGLPAEQADVLLEMFDANAKTYGPKYGLTPEQFYNRIYGGITKGGLGEMQQIAPVNRRMSSVEVQSYARALVRAGESELRSAVQNETNPADRVAILDAAHSLDPKMAEAVGSTARLYQENKGAVTMLDDMRGLIHAYEASDFSTFVHEPAHIFLRQLMNFDNALPEYRQAIAKDWKAVEDWVRVEKKGNTWEAVNGEGKHSIREEDGLFYYRGSSGEEYAFATFEEAQARMTDEMFARGFEKYITEGSAPTKGLARVFEMAKQWMVGIYRAIVGSQIDVKITDEIRGVFDRLLTDEPITREGVDMQAQVDALMKETGVDLFAGTKEMADAGMAGGLLPGMQDATGMMFDVQPGTGQVRKMDAPGAHTDYDVVAGKTKADKAGTTIQPNDIVMVEGKPYGVRGVNSRGQIVTVDGKLLNAGDATVTAKQDSLFGQSVVAQEGKPGELKDFGEKMWGSRKDMAQAGLKKVADVTDADIEKLKLSEIFPKSAVESIEDINLAAVAQGLRDVIPAKPRDAWKVRRWADKVKLVRELVGLANERGVDAVLERMSASHTLRPFVDRVNLLRETPRELWGRIGEVSNHPDAFKYGNMTPSGSEKIPAPFASAEVDGKRISATTFDELKSKVADALGSAKPEAKTEMKFEIRQNSRTKEVFVNRVGDPLYRKLRTFEDTKQAREFLKDEKGRAELVQAWEDVKARDNVKETDIRRAENAPRVGRDHRNGEDATPQMFTGTFGFRGVEFGNWVSQGSNVKERQGMLNAAYDALMDLSNVLNVSPDALSLGGTLGLGLGSRGSGKFSAHFEADTIVINLTKTRGAGTFAHEWFHALDNYFQRRRGVVNTGREGEFITYQPENYYQNGTQRLSVSRFEQVTVRNPSDWKLVEGVRPEVAKAFVELVNALNDSPMTERAKLLDKGTGGYWSRVIERAARSFENYVIFKMGEAGVSNDYLANVQTIEAFRALGLDEGRYPYLLESELKPVVDAFDDLFGTIKTKKENGKTVLYQKEAALFQKAELPLGGMDQASGFIPEGAILDEAYASQLKPLLEAMQAEGRTQSAEGGVSRFDNLTPETQAALMAYAKKVTKREMPAAKLAAVRYGEGMRDWALLNYNKKYGFDKAIENVVPYQFWATRTGMNSALRVFDRPAWFANYFRLQRFASRYERDLPDRLKGKIKIELPFLPEWTGRALYVDPFKQLFPWIQYGQPFDQLRKDKNAQTFEAERVLQEWAADETYSEQEIAQAAQSRAGSVWDAAVAEAAIRRKAEISSPLDFMATLLGPAWYLTMPAKALGLEIPFINSQGEGAESIGLTTMTRTGIAMQQATAGTWAEPLGKLAGMLAKPEQWIREKNGLPEFGEYGEYYIDRQLANLVAEGLVTVDDAKRAMIERSGEAYDLATDRVRTEIMLRTPTAMSVYAGTHGGVGDLLASLPASVLGGGILPEGELRFRGLKEKWNAAWTAYDAGDTQAIGQFFEDHPEYEVYLMKGQSPDERLRNMLTSQIWDAYMGLDKATRRVVTAQLGAQFEHSFLNSETRSPESLSLETLSRWSMMLGHKPPQPPTEGQGAVDVNMPKPDEIPMLEGLPTETRTAMGDYEAAKAEMFPNISQLQNLYFSSSDEDKKRIISIYPELREYWDWRRQYIEANPAAAPFLDKNVAQGIISGELNSWDYGLSQEQAERLIGYYNNEYSVPVKTADYYLEKATPFLLESLSAHQLMGTDLTEGAYKELRVIWEGFGMPGEGFDDWLENVIYATWGW